MDSYVVLARKWRSAQFPEIVGQTHIVRTLSNAIRAERIHQAYLFTGSRGIGKTSIARIFAKVLRCPQKKEEGQWVRSCDDCSSCKEITLSKSVDVLEIDGASNNGVDAIREIRENAKFLPSNGTKKIYIIDEVHMLTTAAFNALLKTLEEPPEHVIFIFATTEPHKIPATILSRCQRYDFKKVTLPQIQNHLEFIAQKEGFQIDKSALRVLSKAADGSMRDALSLLDQAVAYSGKKITSASVAESIGLVQSEIVLSILQGVIDRNITMALEAVDRAYQQGHDLKILHRHLLEFVHNLILAQLNSSSLDSGAYSESEKQDLLKLTKVRHLEELQYIFEVLHQGAESLARSAQPKAVLDILLIKCACAKTKPETSFSPATEKKTPEKPDSPLTAIKKKLSTDRLSELKQEEQKEIPSVSPPQKPTPFSWERFIDAARKRRPLLGSLLEHSTGHMFHKEKNEVLIYFSEKDSYKRDQLKSKGYQEHLDAVAKEFLGPTALLSIELQEGRGESLIQKKAKEKKRHYEETVNRVQNHPIIQEAQALFGGQLDGVTLLKKGEDREPSRLSK